MQYRIYRIKDAPQESFRWSPHVGGLTILKLKDYEPSCDLHAETPYEAWKRLAKQGSPLRAGDVLESFDAHGNSAGLQIAKYIGFEAAQWFVSAAKVEPVSEMPEISA